MLSPRWRKVTRELRHNPKRTLLVVLSIAVGVSAIGMVAGAFGVITRELPAGYQAVNPASATLFVEPFDDELLRVIRNMRGVEAADGRRTAAMRLQTGPKEWRDIDIVSVPDFDGMQVAKIAPFRGDWPPESREVLMERAAMDLIGARIGDRVVIEPPFGTKRTMTIGGVVHDISKPSARFVNRLYGYVTADTMVWMGVEGNYNQLDIVVSGDKTSRDHIAQVASEVRSKVEKSGRTVFWLSIPEPGKHPAERFIEPMSALLSVLGLLCVLLSAFLVINTITALMTQQIRQIGVMKAVGARTRQVVAMYLGLMLMLGLMALAVSIPLGLLATRVLVSFVALLINFDVANYWPPVRVFVLQAAVSLLVPLLASLVPVLKGSRITVRAAMASYGIAETRAGTGLVFRLLSQLRGLSRPLLLSLRNTFRRRARLALTLTTLALASMIFVAVFSVRASLLLTLDDALKYWQYDVGVNFVRPYRIEEIESQALLVPGVVKAESWGYQTVRRLRPDNTNSDNLIVIAPPADTELLQPQVLEGRWLLPEDETAVVITTDLLNEEPDLRVGQELQLEIDGRDTSWLIVGLIRGALSGPTMYANYPYFSRVVRAPDRASSVQIVTDEHTPRARRAVAKQVEQQFERGSLRVASSSTIDDVRSITASQFGVIILFLLAMAGLLALVGALGLTGTMSINVLERTREIGIMRSLGATGRTVRQIVVVEGSLIGLLSWVLGIILAVPISRMLSSTVGASFLKTPLTYSFSTGGATFWLIAVLGLAAVASLWPARDAARLSIRDVLSYE